MLLIGVIIVKLVIEKVLDYEMIHYASDDLFIASKSNKIYLNDRIIKIPENLSIIKKIAKQFRKGRRLFRLDKTIVYPLGKNLVIIRGGKVFHYDMKTDKLSFIMNIACRNPMYLGITATEDGTLYMGEYGKPSKIGKRIFKSDDGGRTWDCIYQFKVNEIRHIHCIAWDTFEKKLWVFTGDKNGECKVISADKSFQKLNYIGDGSQRFRSCHAIFSKEFVDWLMDSPIETVRHI